MCTYDAISSHTDHFEIQIKAPQALQNTPPLLGAPKVIL